MTSPMEIAREALEKALAVKPHAQAHSYEAVGWNDALAHVQPFVRDAIAALSRGEAAEPEASISDLKELLAKANFLTDAQRADIQAHIDGLTADKETYTLDGPPRAWRCFHCGEVFRTGDGARLHFGETPNKPTACLSPHHPEAGAPSREAMTPDELTKLADDVDNNRHLNERQREHLLALLSERPAAGGNK